MPCAGCAYCASKTLSNLSRSPLAPLIFSHESSQPPPRATTLHSNQAPVSLSNSPPPFPKLLEASSPPAPPVLPRVSPPPRAREMGNGRKRRRGSGELGRVAEIVMVLAAAREARGGRAPTAAERALAAEARARLAEAVAAAVGAVGPKELFPREAVRALVEDLGLSRARDPAAMGYRPHRASIAERILLTQRKMKEVKEPPVHPTTNVPQTTTSNATTVFQHGASKSTAGSPRNLSAVASFPATTTVSMSSPNTLRQHRLNEAPAGVSSVKSANIPSIVGSANIKVEKGVNGLNFTQSGAAIGQANKSAHSTATRSNQNTIQSSGQAGKSQDRKALVFQAVIGNTVMGHQAPPGASLVQEQSVFSNHNAIAKNVQQILHQPANHPSWTLPSTEYMHARLDCQICKVSITDVESLLVCDACERGVHLKCLQHYGNKGLPKAEWYCPTCIAHSKGKPLPPKYGKVTRTIVAPKASLASGVTSQRVTTKDNNQNLAAIGSVIKQNSSEAGRTVRNCDMFTLNTSSKEQSVSPSGPQKENVKHAETSSEQKDGHVPPCSGVVTKTLKFSNDFQSSGASDYGGAGNLSERSHMQSESSKLPCAVNPANDSTLQSKEGNSDQHSSKDVKITSSSRAPADQTHQADGAADNRIGKPQEEETTEDNAMSEHDNAHHVTSKEDMCPKHEVMGAPKDEAVGCSTDLSVVDWVGDALKLVNNKTYYNSCNVDGIAYNLQDHILIGSRDSKSAPSKLQSLWEEHESRSKLAMVNPYFFASDIPESISKPCIAEENEVYASNNQRIVMASAICGPCEVFHVAKFREETKRRSRVVSSDSRLHPIFFCRWKYDESTSSFSSV